MTSTRSAALVALACAKLGTTVCQEVAAPSVPLGSAQTAQRGLFIDDIVSALDEATFDDVFTEFDTSIENNITALKDTASAGVQATLDELKTAQTALHGKAEDVAAGAKVQYNDALGRLMDVVQKTGDLPDLLAAESAEVKAEAQRLLDNVTAEIDAGVTTVFGAMFADAAALTDKATAALAEELKVVYDEVHTAVAAAAVKGEALTKDVEAKVVLLRDKAMTLARKAEPLAKQLGEDLVAVANAAANRLEKTGGEWFDASVGVLKDISDKTAATATAAHDKFLKQASKAKEGLNKGVEALWVANGKLAAALADTATVTKESLKATLKEAEAAAWKVRQEVKDAVEGVAAPTKQMLKAMDDEVDAMWDNLIGTQFEDIIVSATGAAKQGLQDAQTAYDKLMVKARKARDEAEGVVDGTWDEVKKESEDLKASIKKEMGASEDIETKELLADLEGALDDVAEHAKAMGASAAAPAKTLATALFSVALVCAAVLYI